jgi:hypothetical protein
MDDYEQNEFDYSDHNDRHDEGGGGVRNTDPDTSHDAAASLSGSDISALQQLVIDTLRDAYNGRTARVKFTDGLITHEIAWERDIARDTISPRMKRLVDKGLVYDTGRRRAWDGAAGRPASTRMSIVWQLESLREETERRHAANGKDDDPATPAVPAAAVPQPAGGERAAMNQIDQGPIMCFVHLDREATRVLNVPCAPDGQLFCCDYCFGDGRTEMFAAYAKVHEARVKAKRAEEKIRKADDN